MPGIDDNLLFRPLNFVLLTISDRPISVNDQTGDCLSGRIEKSGHILKHRSSVRDDVLAITNQLQLWAEHNDVDVILTTGGTGLTGRDVTIDSVIPVFDKTLDGFSALFHRLSFEIIGLAALQSRACAGLINGTFVFCMPGALDMVKQAWDHIIRDALDSRYRPSSLVDILPRLKE